MHHPLTAIVRNFLSKFHICSGTFKFRVNSHTTIRLNCASADHWIVANDPKPPAAKLSTQELSNKVYFLCCMKSSQADIHVGLFDTPNYFEKGKRFFWVAHCFETGVGSDKNDEMSFQWYSKAFESFKSAAREGKIEAQNLVGRFFEIGKGVAKDEVQAAKWFTKAAENGDDDSQNLLGNCYAEGRGVPRDAGLAAKWF